MLGSNKLPPTSQPLKVYPVTDIDEPVVKVFPYKQYVDQSDDTATPDKPELRAKVILFPVQFGLVLLDEPAVPVNDESCSVLFEL